jgi:hypothetical protein
VIEIVEVESHKFVESEIRSAGYLPESGHPGKDEIALAVPVFEELVVAEWQRPRPDKAHLASQDVEEVRNLVE